MKKYTVQFKRTVIEHYLSGVAGFTAVSRKFEVPRSLVQRWVRFYRRHGDDFFETGGAPYTAAFKLCVLKHMWENGLSYGKASSHFNIHSQSAIGNWERSYQAGGFDALEPRPIASPKNMPTQKPEQNAPPSSDETRTREELLTENRRLRMELEYIKKLDALVQSTKAAQRKKRKS